MRVEFIFDGLATRFPSFWTSSRCGASTAHPTRA